MDILEYEQVKGLNYSEYCDYLRDKYGAGRADYMSRNYVYNIKSSRTSEGLIVHHVFEDHAIMLSDEKYAKNNPYEWQLAKNLIYCDYLEHLFLHILITENPSEEKNKNESVGSGGVINNIALQLNDLFSGWQPKYKEKMWMLRCFDRIKANKDVYLALLKRFKAIFKNRPIYFTIERKLCDSYNYEGDWSKKNNKTIIAEIKKL